MQTVSYILKAFAWSIIILQQPGAVATYPVTHETVQHDPLCQTELFQGIGSALITLKQYEAKKAQETQTFQANIERLIFVLSNNISQLSAPASKKQTCEDTKTCKPFSCSQIGCTFRCQSARGIKHHYTMLHIKKNLARVMLCLPENQCPIDRKKNRCSGCHETFTIPGFKKHKEIMLRTYRKLIDPNPIPRPRKPRAANTAKNVN